MLLKRIIEMACILNIETSTTVCSVSLAKDGEIIFDKYSLEGPSHAVLLGVFVEEALTEMKKKRLSPGRSCCECRTWLLYRVTYRGLNG